MLVVAVSRDGFQPLEDQTLTHRPEVGTERVQHVHARLWSEVAVLDQFRVGGLGQGVGHDFGEPETHQQLTPPKQHVLAVGLGGNLQGARHAVGEGHVIKAVDAQDLLSNVSRSRHVAAVGRDGQLPHVVAFGRDVDVQRGENRAQSVEFKCGAQEPKQPLQRHLHGSILHQRGVGVFDGTRHGCSGPFLEQVHAAFRSQAHGRRIHASLEAEARVRAQGVALRRFADGHGMEPRRFQQHCARRVAHATVGTSVHAREAHGLGVVGNDQIARVEFAFLVVQRNEGLVLCGLAHRDGLASNAVQVEGVQGVAKLVENEVGRVDHVVDGLHADGAKLFLRPIWTWPHGNVVKLHGEVVGTILLGHHVQRDRTPRFQGILQLGRGRQNQVVHGDRTDAVYRAMHQSRAQVACHAPVPHGVVPVGGQPNLNHVVAVHADEFGEGLARLGGVVQHQDAVMPGPQTQLVFRANHAHGHFTANLAFLDFERFALGGVQRCAHRGDGHLLAFGDVARATHDVQNLRTHVHLANAQPVGVGVRGNGSDVAHDHPRETAGNVLHALHTFHLQSGGGQHLRGLLDRNIKRKQLSEPAGGDFHELGFRKAKIVLANLLCSEAFSVEENHLHLHPSIGM